MLVRLLFLVMPTGHPDHPGLLPVPRLLLLRYWRLLNRSLRWIAYDHSLLRSWFLPFIRSLDGSWEKGTQWTPWPNHLNSSNTYVLVTVWCLLLSLCRILALLRNGIFFNWMFWNHPVPQRFVLPVSTFAMRLIGTASPCSPARFIRVLFRKGSI